MKYKTFRYKFPRSAFLNKDSGYSCDAIDVGVPGLIVVQWPLPIFGDEKKVYSVTHARSGKKLPNTENSTKKRAIAIALKLGKLPIDWTQTEKQARNMKDKHVKAIDKILGRKG